MIPPAPAGRTKIMGILNVTEDSFSDGGNNPDVNTAVANAQRMISEGADLIDVGGESTRPGATRVPPDTERRRVTEAIAALNDLHIPTSIDTLRASTAVAAIEAGAGLINDVSGGLADPDMLRVAADGNTPICLMHWNKNWGSTEQASAAGYLDHGTDITAHVTDWLRRRIDAALEAGIAEKHIVLDPGIGFGKSPADNWTLLRDIDRIAALGFPLLIGASRKRFLTALRPGPDGNPGTPASADDATAAVSTLAAAAGAWAVRVHNVAPSRAAADVAWCISQGSGPEVDETWRAKRG